MRTGRDLPSAQRFAFAHRIYHRAESARGFFACGCRRQEGTSRHGSLLCCCVALRYSGTKSIDERESSSKSVALNKARVAELADAPDLGSGGAILVGSSPSPGNPLQ